MRRLWHLLGRNGSSIAAFFMVAAMLLLTLYGLVFKR